MKNITIAGNCTKDAELRTTQNGTKVAGFAIAVNGFANGEKTTTFFDVSLWGNRAENVMQFAKKGAKMCVTGDLSTREYNGKTYLDVKAHDFTPQGGGQDNQQGGYHGGNDAGRQAPPADDADSDSIPF